MGKLKKAPYRKRSDAERLLSQWNKINGLCENREWSAAVVRAATAVEISLNMAARRMLPYANNDEKQALDKKLKDANGMLGKFKKILLPNEQDKDKKRSLTDLRDQLLELNDKRNSIVHSGAFCYKSTARKLIGSAQAAIQCITLAYAPNLKVALRDIRFFKVKKS